MNKIELLKQLISKTEDPAELEELNKQLLEAIEDEAREKAEKEAKEKYEAKLLEQKKGETGLAKAAALPGGDPDPNAGAYAGQVKVVEAGMYKGYSLKRARGTLTNDGRIHPGLQKLAKADPDSADLVCKWMVDQLLKASQFNPGMSPQQKAQMVEGTDALGGYTTPTEEREAILSYIREVSLALPNVTTIPMQSDSMTMSREDFKVQVNYTDEASDATETSATFASITLTPKRMDAYTKVSNELIDDSSVPGGIAGLLAGQFFEAVGQKVDSTVFIGTGDPVSGVFLSAGTSVVFSSGSTAFSELLESNMRTAIRNIRTRRLAAAKWYAHRVPTWDYVYGLQDGNNRPYFIESMVAGAPHQAWGYPFLLPEEAPQTSAAATGFIVFGDLRGFIVGERMTNVNLFVDPYSLSRSNSTQYLLFTRWAYAHGLNEYYTRIVTAAS